MLILNSQLFRAEALISAGMPPSSSRNFASYSSCSSGERSLYLMPVRINWKGTSSPRGEARKPSLMASSSS